VAGATATLATLAALWHRDVTGLGQHVDLSAMEAVADAVGWTTADYPYRHIPRARTPGNVFPGAVPYADGWVGLNALSYRNWVRLCRLMQREDLLEDWRFDTGTGRREHGKELLDAAIPWAIERSKWDILSQGQVQGAAVGVILNAQDILDLPLHRERSFFHRGRHPHVGDVTTPGYPFRVLGEDDLPAPEWGPAPALGEHNAELLRDELGYDLAELQRLRVV
jgi:crotonobetainyl-CoA:carnitine CoA-transferase CaiB-like acyl-CoA transferase